MRAYWTLDPSPVWSRIKSYLADDTGALDYQGRCIGVFDGQCMAGAFLVRPWSEFCFEMHGGVDPVYWGRGDVICDLAGRGVFYSTPCLKIVAIVPEFNRMMRACLLRVGLKQEGVVSKSYLKHGKMHDQYIYGITKQEMRKIPVRKES